MLGIPKQLNVDCCRSQMSVYCGLSRRNVSTHLCSGVKLQSVYFVVMPPNFCLPVSRPISCWLENLPTVCCVPNQPQIYCLIHCRCFLNHWKSCHLQNQSDFETL